MINKKDDDRHVAFINAQKTIGGIMCDREQCLEREKRNNKWWMNFQSSHQAINCIQFCMHDRGEHQVFAKLQCCWFIQFCMHYRREHEICQTKSFSKLQSPFPQTIIWQGGAPWPSIQVNWVTSTVWQLWFLPFLTKLLTCLQGLAASASCLCHLSLMLQVTYANCTGRVYRVVQKV